MVRKLLLKDINDHEVLRSNNFFFLNRMTFIWQPYGKKEYKKGGLCFYDYNRLYAGVLSGVFEFNKIVRHHDGSLIKPLAILYGWFFITQASAEVKKSMISFLKKKLGWNLDQKEIWNHDRMCVFLSVLSSFYLETCKETRVLPHEIKVELRYVIDFLIHRAIEEVRDEKPFDTEKIDTRALIHAKYNELCDYSNKKNN